MGTLTPNYAHLLPIVFFQFDLEERWGIEWNGATANWAKN